MAPVIAEDCGCEAAAPWAHACVARASTLSDLCKLPRPSVNRSWSGSQLLILLWLVIEDHDNLFVMAEVVHFLGIGVLLYKLTTKRNAGGELAVSTAAPAGLDAAVSAVLSCCPIQLAVSNLSPAVARRRSVATVAGAHSAVPRSAAFLQVLVAGFGGPSRDRRLCKAVLLQMCSSWRLD